MTKFNRHVGVGRILVAAVTAFGVQSFLPAHQAQAASFPCEAAKTLVEHAICNNKTLSAQDEVIAAQYKKARQIDPATALAEQRAWVAERNHCPDTKCLEAVYNERLWRLNAILDKQAAATSAKPAFWYDCAFDAKHHWQLDFTEGGERLFADGTAYQLWNSTGSMPGSPVSWSVKSIKDSGDPTRTDADSSTFTFVSGRKGARQIKLELEAENANQNLDLDRTSVCDRAASH